MFHNDQMNINAILTIIIMFTKIPSHITKTYVTKIQATEIYGLSRK